MSNIQLVENLYRLRKAHHYTQQEISDLLNISRQALLWYIKVVTFRSDKIE
ncbi:helix-turn-helix domain-containing protein [Mediterraneibacter gnavus]|uniref:helix-turn-helix domain-containing protein n=1 Tax=Mediterraneibacter gnavus TaxID=33038 RepID=UPI001FA9F6AC|nr:helix-turn-helix transcriptional regulator [Mediterraneibacter gnavus]